MRPLAAIVVSSPTRNSARLIAYVLTEKKGQTAGDRFVAASGINGAIPEFAEKQFRDNRKRWAKDGTRTVKVRSGTDATTGEPLYRDTIEGAYVQGYHVIQSFARDGEGALDPEDPEAWEEAHQLGQEFARELAGRGRRAIVITQIDGSTGCVHNHLVIDSIDRTTGKSFSSSNVKHSVLAGTHDALLTKHGYEQINERHSTGWRLQEKSEQRGLEKHREWLVSGRSGVEPFSVAVLKDRIQAVLGDTSYADFDGYAEALAKVGVQVEKRGEKGRGLTYEMLCEGPDGEYVRSSPSRRRRAGRLGRFAMLDEVEKVVGRNLELAREQQQTAKPARSMTMAEMIAAMDDLDAVMAEQRANTIAAYLDDQARERRTKEMRAEARRAEAVAAEEVDEKAVEDPAVDPRMALAEQVCLDASELRRWNLRSPDRYEMRLRGMPDQDVEEAISAWYDLDQPETAWEREREAQHGAPATAGTSPGSAPATAVSSPEMAAPPAGPVVEEQVAETVTKETAELEAMAPVEMPRVVREPAEPQAEETVEDVAEVRAPATAGTTPDPASATADTGPEVSSTPGERDVTPYRSRVRSRKPTREREVPAWRQMVQVDERWQAQLADGQAVDGELAKGLRVSTLQRYEEDLDPAVAYELWRRAAKLAEAKRAREVQQNEERAAAMRAEVDAGDLAWSGEPTTLEGLKMTATRGLTSREKALRVYNEPVLETRPEDGGLER